ncbi:ergothioneine biosynthesis protein EgtB [Phytohalomonas tamaricis]|uniref:ergothioneine biosynthesis protein EgtB n=1 Tax=Phytohalomonas tamaricis TaxID=2081032 RepID=UPI000D0B7E7A|nr:ergothioneine biosynthesis protein EgtB [Phytohalomonas tamaricis]
MDNTARHIRENTLDTQHTKEWLRRFQRVRAMSEAICAPLQTEDYVVQSMPDVSPPKWHLAHVSWFFEAFLLTPYLKSYKTIDPAYDFLFNSYYETHGVPFPRNQRGNISRPTVADVYRFRAHIDEAMTQLLTEPSAEHIDEIMELVEIGLHHEQQHQELLVMDIKHILAQNPLHPVYRSDAAPASSAEAPALTWQRYPGGVRHIGADFGNGFVFDSETPRHRQYVTDFELADRPVTNGEFIDFIEDGGYSRTELWLSDGWHLLHKTGWQAPLYWEKHNGQWHHMTLGGLKPVDLHAPVCHVSFYEADAFANWAGARLPTEAEWEIAAADSLVDGNVPAGNFLDDQHLQPLTATVTGDRPWQMFGDVWEWTGSAYRPYPGFKKLDGSLGEYNGKFMSGQMVLRGGCCATPQDHIRATYRNFFPPHARWAFSGFRLAKDV